MELKIIKGDVFKMSADILVFPANRKPLIGGSLDSRIYELAGRDELLKERSKYGEMHSGDACITDSYDLKTSYKWLVHTVTPVYQPAHKKNTMHKLKKCYLSALQLAEEAEAKSVVFVLLGAGASGFPNNKAIEAAKSAKKRYCSEHPSSLIESAVVVEYENESQYQLLIKCNQKFKEINKLLSQMDGFEQYANPDSEIGKIIEKISAAIKKQSDNIISELYDQYLAEIEEYRLETGDEKEDYCDIVYDKIVQLKGRIKNSDLAVKLCEENSLISRITNITKKPHGIDRKAKSFWKKRENLLRLGIALELELPDMCRLMWCRGHSFPKEKIDSELIELYILEKDYEGAWYVLCDEYGDPSDRLALKSKNKDKEQDI